METVIAWMLVAVGFYLAVGLGFALAFASRGVQRIDPQARGGSWGFRLAILPGTVAFWPLLMRRWSRGLPPPEEANAHRDLALRGSDR
jgi:hypothetical protein